MGQTEYIVRFKGDYSALKKDLEKIDVATKKLEDDEVIIKLHYDGNVKEFNKVFDQMSKMHPELDIQFQYNVNQKMLEQEMDKLQKLSQIKLDVDEDNALIKINKMIDNIELSLQKGLPKEKIQDQLREVFGYYNTAVKSGAKNLDFDNISDRIYRIFDLKGSEFRKIFDDMFDQNATKPIKLFEFDDSVDNELKKTKDRITDIEDTLAGLEKRGASKSGLPSDLQKLQDEIKILRSNIGDMQEQLKDLSGEAFNNMTEQIKLTNEQLNYSLEALTKLKKILSSNGLEINNSVGGVIKQWQDEEETKIGERYTAFNTKTKKTSGAHLVADAEGTSMKLIRSAIDEMGSEAEGTIHSHPMKYAAFSDNDIEMYFKLLKDSQEKIWSHAVTSAEQAISIDMTKVDTSKEEDILKEIRDSYSEIDEKIKGEMGERTADIKNRIISVLDGIESESPLINEMTANIKNGLDEMFKKLGDSYSLTDYQDAFDDLEFDAVNKVAKKYASSMKVDVGALEKKLAAAYTPVLGEIENSIFDSINDQAQQSYQEVLKKVFTNPEFLKSGETSAIKIEALTDFIDWGSIEDSATKATQKAADAIKKAQDSNSPAELTKPLGKDFGAGYAEGIKEAIPDIVEACKQIVLAAYNAVKEANDSEDNEISGFSEGFINSFKESLNNSLPDIQEKIKENFSKLDINEEAYSNFETIGQNIVNSVISGINEHSQESLSGALERIINDVFTNIILNSAVQELIEKMQRAMDYYLGNTPLQISHFDVETDSIIVSIQNALDNKTFNVDLSGTVKDLSTALNTSVENVRMSFIDAIKWMKQANEWQKVNKNPTHERALLFNSKTGEFSNPTVVGNEKSVTSKLKNQIKEYYENFGIEFDTDLHWHQDEDFAAPSSVDEWNDKLISGDLGAFFASAFEDNISKFIVAAQKELAVFDFSKIASSAEELDTFLSEWIADNFNEIEKWLEYNQYRDEDLTLNPRKTVALYLSQIYKNLWDDIRLGYHDIDYSSATLNQKQVRTHISDFGSHIMNYGEPDFMDLTTGELFPISDVFKDVIDKIRDSANVDSFEAMLGGIESDFEEVIVEIFHNIFMSLGDMDSINLDTIRNQVDKDTTKVLTESVKNQRAISEYGLNDYITEIQDTLFSLLKESFFEPSVALEQNETEFQEAGSKAMKELISSNDLIGKLVKYYTPEEFEKEFGANILKNPPKKYTLDDFYKWGISEEGYPLSDGLTFNDLNSDEIAKWKERLLQYFPELIENQAEELYNFMKSDYGNDPEFDKQFIAKINGYVSQNTRKQQSNISQTQLPFSPILPEDFQTQLQNAIEESGRYLIKVYGELVEDFKSRLQNAIDESGTYLIEILGSLSENFRSDIIKEIESDGTPYHISIKGKLIETFKEVLQEAIDSLGAFPIEVKPYMRKGDKIEEVDLPSGNQNNLLSGTTTPSQQFDNEVQQNLVMLENYKNTVAEIGRLKLEPETDETKAKLEELNKLADYFASKITVIRSENGGEVNTSMMLGWGGSGGWSERLKRDYSEEQRKDFLNVAKDRTGLQISKVASEFHGISDEISNIEAKSEGLRNALTKDLTESSTYVSKLRAAYLGIAEANDELKTAKPGSEDFKDYTEQLNTFLSKYPELEKFKDALGYYDKAPEFVKSDEWLDFLATLPQAHTYLESIGYDFDKINRASNETPVSTEDNTSEIEAETKAYVKKSDAIEQLRSNIDNLKKVEADKLINENFSKNEKGRFQIEQTALDELIASLKEKKQIEESATPTTSPVTDNMQSEVETVNQAIEAEKKKFDELKNKISKTIPKAIETKNKAFEKEGNLVAKIVDDEITYFEVLKDSVDNVTDSIEKQQNSVKDLNSKSKSKNPKKSEDTTDKIDKEALLRQHNTELFRNYAQSIGQKSQVQQDMSAYYAQLEKDSAKAYSDAEKKANSLLGKVKKLQNSNKYTQDFVEKLNSAENELTNFLKELSEGTISFDEVDSRVKILSENIENTLSKKAFGSVKQAAEKSLTNVGLKIDQIIAKNSAMGKDFESRFKALRRSLESETTIEGVQKIIAEVNKLESELIATGNTGKSFIDQIKQRLRDINSKYIAQYFSFQDIIRYARQAATNVIQLNDAFIELSKVSNTSLETLERDFQSYADIAHDIGGTISDTINATADWARMGMINAPLYGNI